MEKLSDAIVADGKLLEAKFAAADEMILAGELDYKDFNSPIVRKAIQMQLEYSSKDAASRYDRESLAAVMRLLKQFLTSLKDGNLTESSRRQFELELAKAKPKLQESRFTRR